MIERDLIQAVDAFPGVTILCAGDVMLDRFVYGNVGRISPEAPIPVVSIDHEEFMLGGAGNVVRNLTALGARVLFLTATGDDEAASHIERLLAALPRCTHFVVRDPARRTPVKTRYLAHGQQLLRVDSESTELLGSALHGALLERFQSVVKEAAVAVLSDYAKGVLSGEHARSFIDAGRAADRPVYVDPKGHQFGRYRGASLIKPNLKELGEATRMPVRDEGEVEKAARFLIEDAGVGCVLATRGAAGMMLVCEGAPPVSFRSRAREVFDVSGAGDTVAAALALGTAAGLSLSKAAELCCVAAGLVVAKVGTATLSPGELLCELSDGGNASSGNRTLELSDAIQRVRLWRGMGLRIGFISGGFESITATGVIRLQKARENCDKLVVGLPAEFDEHERSVIVGAMGCVDLVVFFDDAGPGKLIDGLAPEFVAGR